MKKLLFLLLAISITCTSCGSSRDGTSDIEAHYIIGAGIGGGVCLLGFALGCSEQAKENQRAAELKLEQEAKAIVDKAAFDEREAKRYARLRTCMQRFKEMKLLRELNAVTLDELNAQKYKVRGVMEQCLRRQTQDAAFREDFRDCIDLSLGLADEKEREEWIKLKEQISIEEAAERDAKEKERAAREEAAKIEESNRAIAYKEKQLANYKELQIALVKLMEVEGRRQKAMASNDEFEISLLYVLNAMEPCLMRPVLRCFPVQTLNGLLNDCIAGALETSYGDDRAEWMKIREEFVACKGRFFTLI